MTSAKRITDLKADRDFWNRLHTRTQNRLDALVSLQRNGVTWPNEAGGDDLADAIHEVDEANREIAKHTSAAQARLDRARSGENI